MELDLYTQSLLWAFGLSIVFGAIANKANFCTMGAVSDWINMGDLEVFRDAVFAGMDYDKDGRVTYGEFADWDPGFRVVADALGRGDAYTTASKIVFACDGSSWTCRIPVSRSGRALLCAAKQRRSRSRSMTRFSCRPRCSHLSRCALKAQLVQHRPGITCLKSCPSVDSA